MSQPEFVHLHCHSEYSLLDGASRIKDLAKFAAANHMPALALTDHGVMYGIVQFYKACREAGVKPILGCEAYVAARSRKDKEAKFDREPSHLVLLPKDEQGYQNLVKLITASHLEGFYYKPRIDRELLAQHSQGLIVASACIAGEVPRAILDGNYDLARQIAGEYVDIVGRDNFYLELQDHGLPEQKAANEGLLRLAKDLGVGVTATNDSHYSRREDADAHDILLCIQTSKTYADPNRMRFGAQEFYLKTAEEMAALFSEVPEALRNTLVIAEQCNVELDLDTIHMPVFEVPEGETLDSHLANLCRAKLPEKFPGRDEVARKRLEYELEVIQGKGYSGYFLIVEDLVRFAHKRGIIAAARGSAASSVVSYLLDMTYLDPLEFKLIFERFLNPERESSPDIDLDIEDARRQEVYDYAVEKYGVDNVAQIITFGTMAARGAVRDVGRALEYPISEVDEIAKLIPQTDSISEALENVPELRQRHESDERTKRLLEAAMSIEGLARHSSVHACGVVISKNPLTQHIPLQRAGQEGGVITQLAGPDVEACGLVKMDFLGLKNMSIISETLRLLKETAALDLDLTTIPMDDRKTYDMLSRGESTAVFQLESSGMRSLLRDLKPDRFAHIAPLLALYRPGPMDEMPRFVAGRHGQRVEYAHPDLEEILSETFGVLLYQEQVMQAAMKMADFSMPQAEILMRAMSKKQEKKMEQMRDIFIDNCVAKQTRREVAEQVFARMYKFAGYGFNKAHSAAYAVLSYQTAYLKANYPTQYMAAFMTSFMNRADRIALCIEDCRKLGVAVLPPDVNESQVNFSVSGKDIRFALAAIKGVGAGALQEIVNARAEGGPFRDLYDFAERVPQRALGKSAIETLLRCGAFDSLHPNRAQALAALDQAVEAGQRLQRDKAAGQVSLFGEVEVDTTRPLLPNVPDLPREDKLAAERELLGVYVSDHPLKSARKVLEKYVTHTLDELSESLDGKTVVVGGLVSDFRQIRDRKGNPMMFVTLEDGVGSLELIVFASAYADCAPETAKDALILAEGQVMLGSSSRSDDELKLRCSRVFRADDKGLDTKLRPSRRKGGNGNGNGRGNGNGEVAANSTPPPVVNIRVPQTKATPGTLNELQGILKAHPGNSGVLLHIDHGRRLTQVSLGSGHVVRLDAALQTELELALGRGTVWTEQQPRVAASAQ